MKTFWSHIVSRVRSFGKKYSSENVVTSNEAQEVYDLPNLFTFFQDTFTTHMKKETDLFQHINSIFTKCNRVGNHFKEQGKTDGPFHMRYSVVEVTSKETERRVRKEIQGITEKEQQEIEGYADWIGGDCFVNNLSQFLYASYLHGYECSFDKYNTELAA